MKRGQLAWGLGAAGCLVLGAGAGCYEQHSESPPAAGSAEGSQPPADSGGTTYGSGARPSHSQARGAAERTVDRMDEHQREIEKAIEDQE
jgi:hypothetical protein